jgi:DNA repair exonuclease SbcCD ATPase subunit
MSSLNGKDDMEKLKSLNSRTYNEQATWILNVLWKKLFEKDAGLRSKIWESARLMTELDAEKGKQGNELNEFDAHRFLEKQENTMTVLEMRSLMKKIDIDFNKKVSLSEYLIVKYDIDWHMLVNAKIGENKDEIDKAQAKVDDAQKKLHLALKRAADADKAEKEQVQAENELKRALQALNDEEKAYQDAITALANVANDASKGIVTRNKANNELAQMKAKDPLPLQRAKINQAAAVRKSEKATAKAMEARAEAEKSLAEAQAAFDEAQKYMDEVSKMVGSCEGTMWWMQRELEEAKKYLPQSKGGVAKK